MAPIAGRLVRTCDGFFRREWLHIEGLSTFRLILPQRASGQTTASQVGRDAMPSSFGVLRGTVSLRVLLYSLVLSLAAFGSPNSGRAAEARTEHWAFQPPARPEVPAVRNAAWTRNPIDAFVAARHEARGLVPASPAERNVLLRRVYLDLVGLPPTREELEMFLADSSQDAYDRVVGRLLASPHYGERWGRHWMDVWRYSDWYGRREVKDVRNSYPHLWRWRDWIVRSLNEDKGYDRMVLEMLAADEIDPDNDANIVATGFLVRSWFSLNYDQWMKDLVEHTGKAFLGIRLNCAHCHDHKYDPITQEEYFRFRAFFEPLELRHDRVPGGPPLEKYKRYVPGSGASLKPIPAGLARVFDADLDAKTFMYKLGDARDRFDRPPVAPGVPSALHAGRFKIGPVELPPRAWYPGLKEFVQREETARRETALHSAERALSDARQRAAEFTSSRSELARLILEAAEAKLAAARADLSAVQARIEADVARYSKGEPDADALVRAARRAEREAALAAAEANAKAAEQALAEAALRPASDKKKEGELKAARKRLAGARQAVAKAETALQSEANDYTPVGPQYPRHSTGRRSALARWITREQNPLTARVAVNHIWMRHFGRPLVETVVDFGRGGQEPTHPDLLDWLAVELMESGWSMKRLHRLIVTSNTYRLSSKPAAAVRSNESIDRDNRYWWRCEPRRMQAEAVRDSVLCASSRLDRTIGGPEIDPKLESRSRRRSLYFSLHPEAGGTMKFLEMFDAPDPCDCYRRRESIVPQQALALANSRLVRNESRALARRLWEAVKAESSGGPDVETAFVTAAFQQVISREPGPAERQACREFLAKQAEVFRRADLASLSAKTPSGAVPASADPARRARESLIHALFSHSEFATIR